MIVLKTFPDGAFKDTPTINKAERLKPRTQKDRTALITFLTQFTHNVGVKTFYFLGAKKKIITSCFTVNTVSRDISRSITLRNTDLLRF